MAKLTFYTRSKKNPAPIRAYFSFGVDKIVYAKGIFTVSKEDWSNSTGAVKKHRLLDEECKKLQDHLDNISTIVYQRHNNDGDYLPQDWLQKIVDRYKSTCGHNEETAIQYANRVFTEYKEKKRPGLRGKMLSEETADTYLNFLNILKRYETEKNLTLRFNDITIDFYYEYNTWLIEEDYSANSIYNAIRCIKQFMAEAKREHLHKNLDYLDEEFRAVIEEADSIALTKNEVHAWEALDLSAPEQIGLKKSRDLFLCGVYSAQRYRDYSHIEPGNVGKMENIDVIRFYQHKTATPVTIPISPKFKALLELYDNYSPRRNLRDFGKDLKTLGEMAEINSIVLHRITKGGETIVTQVPKFELITTHTARRTAATLMVKAGYPVVEVMKMTGHKTYSQFMKYIRTTEEEIVTSISNRDNYV
ncbi:phage integrase SAM-like domain-containing protein [Odoribacter splanchnicus]|uniref:phage integrase SAM-like domain-containing protein n=1 Tax=Odoribacter splanchnicus TaxID=28118 RepID=UPI00189B3387|nr:phage integrase SAM-like domain-containing protein [Odoribacter splanchnicus]MDB9209669.1 phage integrase SAM-like domain-containing protein [Odoribacter splanchnicus]MDB9225383.1 phage integrase SAM-like domain-containing protein [Odoribacter splanchnicus]MDB9237844.1 phage integrase SAM-like domain-containing protein [Odoribacter splanchnicus]MDB9241802.1 phage integrase SAM-like domain-containing protein [Odoribacter splanchnicus]HJG19179.1 site-specific integrase [Odoribacter splanchnic